MGLFSSGEWVPVWGSEWGESPVWLGKSGFPSESEDGTSLGLPNDATRKGEKKAWGGGGEAGKRRAVGDWGRNVSVLVGPSASLSLEEALLRFRLKFWFFYGYRWIFSGCG